MEEYILMTRPSEKVSWGFRLCGGVDHFQRLSIQKVQPRSLASTSGLHQGDYLLSIGGKKTEGLTHQEALDQIKQSENCLRLTVVRCSDLTRSVSYPSQPISKETPKEVASDAYQNCCHCCLSNPTCPLAPTPFNCLQSVPSKPKNYSKAFTTHQTLPVKSYPRDRQWDRYTLATSSANMNESGQQQIPDQLMNHFGQNKRPEDKPFTYIPIGGIAELQQRSSLSAKQREVASAPRVRPKPKSTSRQGSYAGSETSQMSYDSASLFTPAYLEMLKNQEELRQQPLPAAVPTEMIGYEPGKIPQEDVAAYILQPDGTMAALRPTNQQASRWNDKPGPNLQKSAVMTALLEEQNAQMHGSTTGRIHTTNNGNTGRKQGLSFKVLQWLTGTDSEDGSETTSNYSGSHDGVRQRHPTCDSQNLQETIREGDSVNSELEYLYSGSKLPSKSFRRLLRSVSSTTVSTDEVSSLPSPTQEPEPAVNTTSTQASDTTRKVSHMTLGGHNREPCAYSDF